MRDVLAHISGAFGKNAALQLRGQLWLAFFAASFLLALPVAGLAMLLGGAVGVTLSVSVYAVGLGLAASSLHRSYSHDVLGLCNIITIARLALTAALLALLAAPVPPPPEQMWIAFAVAVLALALDGADGWAARRAGLASQFGARFDMEVDSLFALVLALIAFQAGQVGPWVLALGLPRYLFVAAGIIWPFLTREVPDNLSRKAVCVLQIGTLVACLVPILPAGVLTVAAALAAVALIWSFLRDIRLLIALR